MTTTRKLIPTTKYTNKEIRATVQTNPQRMSLQNPQRNYFQFGVRTKVSCGNIEAIDVGNVPITDQIV